MNLKVGRLWMLDVASFLKFQISKRTPCFSAQPAACHHGGLHSSFQAEGSQNAECDGAQFENQVRYSQYKFGEVGKVGNVPSSPPKKGVQGSQHFLTKTCKKSQRKRRMRTGTKKTPAKPIGPNCWVFSLNFEICINKNPLLHSKKGL